MPAEEFTTFIHEAQSGQGRLAQIFRCVFLAMVLVTPPMWAEQAGTVDNWEYRLLEGSYLINDCLICGRPTILEPMRGTFTLTAVAGASNQFRLSNISFRAGRDTNLTYQVTGEGSYERRSNPTNDQEVVLRVKVNEKNKVFTNAHDQLARTWPLLEFDVDQTDLNLVEFYRLHVRAAPIREIWFSSVTNFSVVETNETNLITAGDFISSEGRVVRSNYGLLSKLGVLPFVKGNYGLDAADVARGGEILVSLEQDAYSETVGKFLREGDLLSTRGTIIATNGELLAAFRPSGAATNAGLDAVKQSDEGMILFSVRTNFFSDALGRTISRGDLLSSDGRVVRSQRDLLARFHPAIPSIDAGLDAFYFWPGGEIWFSTEDAFVDNGVGPIGAGDLLSDEGYIVFRNKDLLEAFHPVEREVDLGLDSLVIISDAIRTTPGGTLSINYTGHDETLRIAWESTARVWQLESATTPEGPYQAMEPLDTEVFFLDTETGKYGTNRFYRLRQW